MARFPGTETTTNKAGWTPGATVRCRRSRANGSRGLADRRGVLCEVRHGHVRLLLDAGGCTVWLENEAVLAEADVRDPELETMRRLIVALRGRRLEVEDDELVIYGDGFPAEAVDEARALLGERLVHMEITPHGVHELACRLTVTA